MTNARRPFLLLTLYALAFTALIGCGGGASPEEGNSNNGTSGSEAPVGPPPSFLPEAHRVLAKLDMARVRRSPVAADVESAIAGQAMWQELTAGSGIQPVQELDAMVIASEALYADRRVAVLRYVGTEAMIRDHLLQMSIARSIPLTWSEAGGFAVSTLPVPLAIPHSVVLTAAHEIVICPTDDVARIAEVARNQALRRAGNADMVVEPTLNFAAQELATADIRDRLPAYAGYPTPPNTTRVNVMEDDATHYLFVYIHADFANEADAQSALDWVTAYAAQYAGHFLVRSAGLSRPLEALQGTRAGTAIDLQTNLTPDETRRALGAAALLQMMQANR
jgi:hypothetical protein